MVVSTPDPTKSPPEERAVTWRVVWVVTLGAILSWSLLIAGVLVTESLGRERLTLFVAERVQSMLSLESGHPVNVDIGGGLLVFQALGQRLDRVEVTAQDVSLGELAGDVHLTATGVPFDTTRAFERVHVEVRVDEDVVSSVTSSVTDSAVTSVELEDPLVSLGTTLTIPSIVIFGITITQEINFDVGIGLEPFVSEGRIAFTPVSFEVNGTELSAEAFANVYRDAAQTLTRVGAICVADQLPAALQLETVAVSGNKLVIGLGATDAVFSSETLATRGACD